MAAAAARSLSFVFLVVLYGMLPFVEVIAPYASETRNNDALFAPPADVNWFHDGEFVGPFVYRHEVEGRPDDVSAHIRRRYDKVENLRFICDGDAYRFWGLVETRFHLVCPAEGGRLLHLRHRPAGARYFQPRDVRRADFADHRIDRALRSVSCWAACWAGLPDIWAAGSMRAFCA